MMVAKMGDIAIGTCICVVPPVTPFPATGVITTGNVLLLTTGLPVADNLSIVMFPCGPAMIIAPQISFISGPGILARTGNMTTGCGIGTVIGTSQIISF